VKIIFSVFCAFTAFVLHAFAQAPVTYNDVALIINDNDTNSIAIGNYFIGKRNIRVQNVVHISAPAKETINDTEFEALRAQIENYLTASGLKDSINFIVTTKGVPLRVDRGGTGGDVNSKSASVDAELMLILGQWSSHVGQATLLTSGGTQVRVHPYFSREEHFIRNHTIPGGTTPYDLYLVTRLIGLTKEDVFALIDHSGPHILIDKDSALCVLDRDPTPIDATYNNHLTAAALILQGRGWNVLLNNDSIFVTKQRNVLGYGSWGSNDNYSGRYTQKARPMNSWLAGSLAETFVSTSARNFMPGQESGQSRIADLIAEGCTGASGYVFEPFSLALTWVNLLLDRYTSGYNLAESFYMANPTMSWMAVIVGDPKTSIITHIPPIPEPLISGPATACERDVITLAAHNALDGNMYWFKGDSAAVLATGPPFDETHPLWIGRDTLFAFIVSDLGMQTFTFVNENFVGKGLAQTSVFVLPPIVAGFMVSTDSVYLDEDPTLRCTDTTKGAISWDWNFGDLTGHENEQSPSHMFTRSGFFIVSLNVSNGTCTSTVTKSIRVFETKPVVRLTERMLDFHNVQAGKTKMLSFKLLNKTLSPISITAATVRGAQSSSFGINAYTFPFTVAASDSATWFVTFKPMDAGMHYAYVEIETSIGQTLVVDLSGNGVLDPVGVMSVVPNANAIMLYQNYPNPFTTSTEIRFLLARKSQTELSVSTLEGRTITTLAEGELDAGFHSAVFEPPALPSGIYLYTLKADGQIIQQLLTVLK